MNPRTLGINPKIKVMTVTPDWAKKQLEQHAKNLAKGKFRQRRVSKATVRKYATDMKLGFWKWNPNPIVFDEAGCLLDGQHRLMAVVLAGVPVIMTGCFGAPTLQGVNGHKTRTIDQMDCGRPRGIGGRLEVGDGYKNGSVYAACALTIASLMRGGSYISASFAQLRAILEDMNFKTHIDALLAFEPTKNLRNSRIIGPMAFLRPVHEKVIDQFAKRLFRGTGLDEGDPEQMLGRWFANHNAGVRRSHAEICRSTCAALRAALEEKTVGKIMPRPESVKWIWEQNSDAAEKIESLIAVTGLGSESAGN